MRLRYLAVGLGIVFSMASSLVGQQEAGTIATLEFQKVKIGMVNQYEAGRKQKAAWHKQQNDTSPLLVWEILSGENTGTYVVGRLGQHWTDMDKPAVPDESDRAEFAKVVANYVDSITTRYYEFLPKVSNPAGDKAIPKFAEVLTFHVKYGKSPDFRSAMDQICQATQKTKWPLNYEWYSLASGGRTGTFALVLPHKSWADFEDKPEVKPFRDMLKEAFGQGEADSIVNRINESVQEETSEIIQFRSDLSYLPSK